MPRKRGGRFLKRSERGKAKNGRAVANANRNYESGPGFHGPVRVPTRGRFEALETNIGYQQLAISSAGGVLDFTFTTGGNTTGARALGVDFATLATAYGDYFIQAMSVEFIPNFMGSNPQVIAPGTSTVAANPWLTVCQLDSQSVAGSYANIFTNDTRTFFSANERWSRIVRCERTAELTAIPVGSDFVNGAFRGITLIAEGCAPVQTYGILNVNWRVKFTVRE